MAWFDGKTGQTRLDTRPVHAYTLSDDIAYIEPKARAYWRHFGLSGIG